MSEKILITARTVAPLLGPLLDIGARSSAKIKVQVEEEMIPYDDLPKEIREIVDNAKLDKSDAVQKRN